MLVTKRNKSLRCTLFFIRVTRNSLCHISGHAISSWGAGGGGGMHEMQCWPSWAPGGRFRFQCLPLTSIIFWLTLHYTCKPDNYRKRGSASYIVREVLLVRERERERERDTDRQRRKWRHHCRAKIGDEFTLSLAKNSHLAMSYTFPCRKFAPFDSPFTLPISPFLNGHHCGAEIRNEFSLSVAKKLRPLCSDSLKWRDCSFYRKNESN